MRPCFVWVLALSSVASAETFEWTAWNVSTPPAGFRAEHRRAWVVAGSQVFVTSGTPSSTRLVHVSSATGGVRVGPIAGEQLFVIERDVADRPCFYADDGGANCLTVPSAAEPGQSGVADLAPLAGPEFAAFDRGVAVTFTTAFSSGRKLTQVAFVEPSGARTLEVFTPGSPVTPAGPDLLTASGDAILWTVGSSVHAWNGSLTVRQGPWASAQLVGAVRGGPALLEDQGALFGVRRAADDFLASCDAQTWAPYGAEMILTCTDVSGTSIWVTDGTTRGGHSGYPVSVPGGFVTTETHAFWFDETPGDLRTVAFDQDIIDYFPIDGGSAVFLGARESSLYFALPADGGDEVRRFDLDGRELSLGTFPSQLHRLQTETALSLLDGALVVGAVPQGLLFISGPRSGLDAGLTDAGLTDAGLADAGLTDAGLADAGLADAGSADAGRADAGRADAGLTDAGDHDHLDEQVPPRGCGCSEAPALSVLGLLAGCLLRRRRAR